MISYIYALWIVGRVPAWHAVAAWVAASAHGVDPDVLGGYLISEHGDDWTQDETKCSGAGACGPWQLVERWCGWAGYARGCRTDTLEAADTAAQLVAYSKRRHAAKCGSSHDWRAHLKAGSGGRDRVGGSVRRWLRYEQEIKAARGVALDMVSRMREAARVDRYPNTSTGSPGIEVPSPVCALSAMRLRL